MTNNNKTSIEFCIDDLGYLDETLETRAIVMSKVLKDMGVHYKRYYISKSIEGYKRVKKPAVSPPEMSIAFMVECDGDYVAFAWYSYRKRMNDVIHLRKSFNLETNDLDTL